jgi:hypothetical protein
MKKELSELEIVLKKMGKDSKANEAAMLIKRAAHTSAFIKEYGLEKIATQEDSNATEEWPSDPKKPNEKNVYIKVDERTNPNHYFLKESTHKIQKGIADAAGMAAGALAGGMLGKGVGGGLAKGVAEGGFDASEKTQDSAEGAGGVAGALLGAGTGGYLSKGLGGKIWDWVRKLFGKGSVASTDPILFAIEIKDKTNKVFEVTERKIDEATAIAYLEAGLIAKKQEDGSPILGANDIKLVNNFKSILKSGSQAPAQAPAQAPGKAPAQAPAQAQASPRGQAQFRG